MLQEEELDEKATGPRIPSDLLRTAWTTGRLSGMLRNGQKLVRKKWLESKAKQIKTSYLECTRRFGKTTFGLTLLSEDAIKGPNRREIFVAPIGIGLKEYIKKPIAQVYADCPDDLKPDWIAAETKLLFPNNSEIVFRAANLKQATRRRGNAYNNAFIDEARDVDDLEELIEGVIMPTLFDSDGFLMLSSTPAHSTDHPLHSYREASIADQSYISFTIDDAQKIDPEYFPLEKVQRWKENAAKKSPVHWQREYMCQWVRDTNLTIVPEWKADYIQEVPHDEFFKFHHKYFFLDVGVNDATSVLFGYYDFLKAKAVIEDEIWLVDAEVTTQAIVEQSKQKEIDLKYEKMYRRIGDCAAKLTLQDLSSSGLSIGPCKKTDLFSMVSRMRLWVGAGRILVHPRCTKLIACLENGTWNKDHTAFAKSKALRHFDPLAALMYGCIHIDQQTNPIPANFGISEQTHMILPRKIESKTGETLRKAFGLDRPVIRRPTQDWRQR